jgi:hypothetical protein
MTKLLNPDRVYGLRDKERAMLVKLIDVYEDTESKNRLKERYYNGKITLREVNLGIALPEGIRGLEIGCAWGPKTVD